MPVMLDCRLTVVACGLEWEGRPKLLQVEAGVSRGGHVIPYALSLEGGLQLLHMRLNGGTELLASVVQGRA